MTPLPLINQTQPLWRFQFQLHWPLRRNLYLTQELKGNSMEDFELDTLATRIASKLGVPVPGLGADRPLVDIRSTTALLVASVEYTQSIQFNGTAGQGYGPNNSVRLVAYKSMVARAYPLVQRGTFGSDTLTGQRVTGELTLSIGDRVIYSTGPTRSEGARIGAAAHLDRGSWDREVTIYGKRDKISLGRPIAVNCPLNFLIPAYCCQPGRMYATVHLWPVNDGPASPHACQSSEYLNFISVQPPKVCLVRISWQDGQGNVTRPTDVEMLTTVADAGRMLPFPYFESTILGFEETRSDNFAKLSTNTGGCNAAWSSLITRLNVTRIFTRLFGLGNIVYGMVSQAAIPASGNYNSGCGNTEESGAGFSGKAPTFAHEIGHLYKRVHVAVAGNSDPNYPNYGGSVRSIGEVGIDTGTFPPKLYEPWNSDDIMSYSNHRWISPYTYEHILDQHDLYDTGPIDLTQLRLVFVLDFRVHRTVGGGSRVEVRSSTLLEAPGPLPSHRANAVSPLSLDILDGNEQILATHHCTWAPMHGGGNCNCCSEQPQVTLDREPWLDFQEVMEWPASAVSAIVFHRGGEPFHTLQVGEPPEVAISEPVRDGSYLVAQIRTTHPREPVTVTVLFSTDKGTSWQPIAFDPPDGQLKLCVDQLTGGDFCVLRAIATAELRSATADTAPFMLQRTARRIYLCMPSHECPQPSGPVVLSAVIDSHGLGAPATDELRWTSNLDGDLGFGYSLIANLREGRHVLTLTAPDGDGGTLAQRGIIIVSGRGS